MNLRIFGVPFGTTAVGLIGALLIGGWEAFALVAILSVLEISLSFDNAVVNAKVIERMSQFWQRMFLTIGILIAVFGMRLAFPLLIVGITAQLSPAEAISLAVNDPAGYGARLHEAHPMIAAFGGMFLLMLFLDFVFEEHDFTWLAWLERPLARIGKLDQLSVAVALVVLVTTTTQLLAEPGPALIAGVLGIVTYLLVNGLGELFQEEGGEPGIAYATGRAGFFLFLYLEVLDASFSFDGVIGAFAISDNLFVITAGLGIGAMYVRALTIYLVRRGTLSKYVHLEHGAHWAIGALAVIMVLSFGFTVPEVVTGLIGLCFIGTAMITSTIHRRSVPSPSDETPAMTAAKS
ncbi:hypothetical protein Acor_10000 [Acrocarpospora corrugata]|uniref:Integral membrane protein n=1 Tax=Acrocarpospora corrugata TaxID=35763 RepID=A0A5M3VQ75_9ACTN|nr:DUF475 domain-containing protein [Acrocarpospora corrugata]GER98936.1 hypothetical protein Acor_10000 [Acrocarpospora corrugata]